MREERAPLVRRMNEEGVPCGICPSLAEAGVEVHCFGEIGGMHERRKSGAGGSRVNPKNLIPACNWGNGWIEDQPKLARELFGSKFVLRDEDREEWEEMSKRNDRI